MKLIAEKLLEIEAIFLRPNDMFTWASGIKSPIYCDNRISLSYPEFRSFIKNSFVDLIKAKFPDTNLLVGVAMAGIPQASLIADAMNLPLAYVRSSPKDHGRANLIEGRILPNSKALVVEDLISTASSSLKVIEALKAAQVEVLGLVSIFDYGLEIAKKNLLNLPYFSLSNYDELLEVALEKAYINKEDLEILNNWRKTMI